jgi:SNF2 family DNA or RNA helicase
MLAVQTSDLEPLPHQIQAVYGELLGRTPLRFLLADDPGAGKTIMAGLYIKELMLRGDLERCLIVAPGGLVEQWQDELREKFGLGFELLTRQLADAQLPAAENTVFTRHKLLIARMDQLSRAEDLRDQLERSDWDLVVVDEAHRMSAHYFGNELKKTRRYQLGELLGRHARHLLLMTATPHAGREEDFQLFLALLDTDRFEGRYRDAVHTVNTDGLMRRMVKEDLKTFDGRPLFPERRAYTVAYELSDAEQELYEAVTHSTRTTPSSPKAYVSRSSLASALIPVRWAEAASQVPPISTAHRSSRPGQERGFSRFVQPTGAPSLTLIWANGVIPSLASRAAT